MLDRINGIASNSLNVPTKAMDSKAAKVPAFKQILQQKTNKVNVSKHAQQRLVSRNLQLGQDDIHQLSTAMNELKAKGSKESLLVYKNMGIIANVQNRTIITAMDMNELETVTNIDSTKFIK
ncbi:TIGR02530 family flagellar biosynthesis protein [Liquorilactobacillus nagelii]|jgi:flagellar operon protein|uniref:Flagellar operon protein n=1 Tax=Liquorilactobacillus nagelii TaxID=82688 RepID=A0A0A7RFY5_9LACO|nr:TIGR02530 family flagellar biosynthesis protein [Liquorilactobacillus nagelii]AJA34156.1 flagellar operon protein [Liquorilactobacillus nagelii]KRL42074.1 hypothetical protein FD45_GL000307 [Liquorilactobacillus nagelii DSM 13675]MCI1633809.1 flagellar protein [Liquorilactobacillus nagelii]QYH55049.1 flagellar protein [Liquorilactobacillus nagelii DSM 13675]